MEDDVKSSCEEINKSLHFIVINSIKTEEGGTEAISFSTIMPYHPSFLHEDIIPISSSSDNLFTVAAELSYSDLKDAEGGFGPMST